MARDNTERRVAVVNSSLSEYPVRPGAHTGCANIDVETAEGNTAVKVIPIASALDYAGVPVDYHVGPAWLAGATERVLGYGLYGVSFGLVPLLSILSTAIATLYLLHLHGIPYRLSAAAAAYESISTSTCAKAAIIPAIGVACSPIPRPFWPTPYQRWSITAGG